MNRATDSITFVYSQRSKYFHRQTGPEVAQITACSGKRIYLSTHVIRPLQNGDPANWTVENQATGGRLSPCRRCWA